MTSDVIRTVVEHFSADVFGTRYSLRVIAAERCAGSGACTLRVEIRAGQDPGMRIPLHILACASDASDLREVLDRALHQAVFEYRMSTATREHWTSSAAAWAATMGQRVVDRVAALSGRRATLSIAPHGTASRVSN